MRTEIRLLIAWMNQQFGPRRYPVRAWAAMQQNGLGAAVEERRDLVLRNPWWAGMVALRGPLLRRVQGPPSSPRFLLAPFPPLLSVKLPPIASVL